VVDDLIAYLHGDDEVFLVPNAANAAEVARRLTAAAPAGVDVSNEHLDYAVIAVQGPRSADVLAQLDLPAAHPYMSFVQLEWRGIPLVVCRTGYTGERGYELLPPARDAGAVWDALLDAAASVQGRPAGLGARDTLRTEMGYPLHGQDLSLDITPVQARLGWAVGWRKDAFWGREALLAERAAGQGPLLRGLLATDRGIPRPGMTVTRLDGTACGTVTSGTFSPTRRRGIGLALLDRSVEEGAPVQLDVRGRTSTCEVVRPPFVAVSPG
jgi:aminomethyltransferase